MRYEEIYERIKGEPDIQRNPSAITEYKAFIEAIRTELCLGEDVAKVFAIKFHKIKMGLDTSLTDFKNNLLTGLQSEKARGLRGEVSGRPSTTESFDGCVLEKTNGEIYEFSRTAYPDKLKRMQLRPDTKIGRIKEC